MIEIPITIGHDYTKIIGTMNIDETKLPPTADFCFGLGVRVHEYFTDTNGVKVISKFDMVEVSIVDNLEYFNHLNKRYYNGQQF